MEKTFWRWLYKMLEQTKKFYLGEEIFPELTRDGDIPRGKISSLNLEDKSFEVGGTIHTLNDFDQTLSIKDNEKDKNGAKILYLEIDYTPNN